MLCDLHGGSEQSVALRIDFGNGEKTCCIKCILKLMESWQKTIKGNFGGFIKGDS